ncbi:TetR family transcriptional regulator [Kitasatospora phosalacinea]|uniref:TetR family transcriptional regulator n=1 Tax=Kitasatospora phosalacinea TaxID=2065 RepID=A0A9W6QHQ6_9ACTN|nr:TetR family transcriptional regulator [Kitasatospora phosalacinea]GLW75023.1 TetR family transcriptional regulator [Kitasatospora phosalacinea]
MTPPPGADSTRDRIVAAATAEFARHGIAGARIERIAKAARTSKERLYAYFRGKEELYATVAAAELTAVAEATRLDPTDLPAYAGRLHDYFSAHPDRLRLMSWGRLELSPDPAPDATGTTGSANAADSADDPVRATVRHKTEQLRLAQQAGHLDPSWDPLDVLVLLNQLATAWAGQSEFLPADEEQRAAFLADRRAAVVRAVQRLFPAATS